MNPLATFFQYVTAPFRWLIAWPARLVGVPGRVLGLSLPARAAWLLALALVLITGGVAIYLIVRDDFVASENLYRPSTIATTLLVLIATPVAAYYLLKLWIEGDVARFPDIDEAWSAGLAALAENRIDLTDLPLFLVIGVGDEALVRRTMSVSGAELVINGVPRGASPLRWYASQDAVYLVVEGAGWLPTIDTAASAAVAEPAIVPGAAPSQRLGATMVVGSGAVGGTPEAESPNAAFAPQPIAAPLYGTLVLDSGDEDAPALKPRPAATRRLVDEDAERLRYVAGRLRRARQPYCGNNGVLALLPVHVLEDIMTAKDAPTALRGDLGAIRHGTRLISPVTLCVVGLESELGLRELVTRVGVERAAASRFGKRFDVWNEASDENLDALSAHACGAFEDWVYQLFRDGLQDKENVRLYSLLSRVRHRLQPRLRSVLVKGVAVEGDASTAPPVLFGGCYFAATGDTPDQQAFIRSVFDRVAELANDLCWQEAASNEDRACRFVAQSLIIASLGLLVAVAYFLYKLLG